MLFNFKRYFELYCESLTGVVWHYSDNPVEILKSNIFSLGSETGADATKSGKAFYLSTARSKMGSYSENPRGIIFKLDGDLLNTKYKAKSIDYWGKSGFKERHGGKHEMEDRLYSTSPTIPNARNYILEVNAWGKPDLNNRYLETIKKVEELCKDYNIPFVYYTDYRNFISNKDPKKSLNDVIDTSQIEYTKYKSYSKYDSKTIREVLLFVTQLKDPNRRYGNYDGFLSLSNDYHNSLRRKHSKSGIYAKTIIAKILKKLKLKNVDDLFKLRTEQKMKLDRIENDSHHLKYVYNKFLKILENDDDPFEAVHQFNQYFQNKKEDDFYALMSVMRNKNIEKLSEIFNNAKQHLNREIESIQSTLFDIPLRDLNQKPKDESWKDVQI